ncbi:hypothetical protein EDB86DRAFT_1949025 [Lactarius hatsudake]|nr:hypothetical protein EDB86DRAFT_1949025 [Lactarius hatsudake]
MSSPPHLDDSSRPMPTRLFSSLKRPFSRPKNDHDRNPSSVRFSISLSTPLSPNSSQPERTRGPIHGEAPPNYQQIAMGLHLSRTPHFPAHIAHLYPPSPQPRLHRSPSSPSSSTPPRTPPRTRASSLSLCPPSSSSRSRAHHPHSPSRSPSRLLPPPARSALKKPRAKAAPTTSSSVTPDTASASTVASSVLPQTPTRSLAGPGGLLARFLGKERGHAARALVVLADETVRERKAVRFGGLEEEDEP